MLLALSQTFAARGPVDLVEQEDPGQSVHITIVWKMWSRVICLGADLVVEDA